MNYFWPLTFSMASEQSLNRWTQSFITNEDQTEIPQIYMGQAAPFSKFSINKINVIYIFLHIFKDKNAQLNCHVHLIPIC